MKGLQINANIPANAIDRYTTQSGGADAAFDAAKAEAVSSWGSSLASGIRFAQLAVPQNAVNARAKGRVSQKRDGKDGDEPVTERRSPWDDESDFGDAPGGAS